MTGVPVMDTLSLAQAHLLAQAHQVVEDHQVLVQADHPHLLVQADHRQALAQADLLLDPLQVLVELGNVGVTVMVEEETLAQA